MISHVRTQVAHLTSPADERIISKSEDVDRNSVLQRVMEVPVRSVSYTDEWAQKNSVGSDATRSLIGQDIAKVMPEWVDVVSEVDGLQDFHEIKDRQVAFNTLAALQAMHHRLTLRPDSTISTGRVDISSADAEGSASGGISV